MSGMSITGTSTRALVPAWLALCALMAVLALRDLDVPGPYYDERGWPLYLGGGSLVIERDGTFVGTGHADVFSENGVDWLVHHAKDSERDHRPYLNIRRIEWDEQGWPSVCRP